MDPGLLVLLPPLPHVGTTGGHHRIQWGLFACSSRLCIYLFCVYVHMHMTHAVACVRRSEDSFQESVIPSFHRVGPGGQTQAMRLNGKHLYPLSPLIGPIPSFKRCWGLNPGNMYTRQALYPRRYILSLTLKHFEAYIDLKILI